VARAIARAVRQFLEEWHGQRALRWDSPTEPRSSAAASAQDVRYPAWSMRRNSQSNNETEHQRTRAHWGHHEDGSGDEGVA
jgi:hypothetical protein